MNTASAYTRHILCAALLTVATCGTVAAQSRENDIIVRAATAHSPMDSLRKDIVRNSAGAFLFNRQTSFTQIDIRTFSKEEDVAFYPQLGNKVFLGEFNAASYMKLDNKSGVEAGVNYTRGVKKNVKWNSTADFLLLYPYIQGDSIGGNLQHETYSFYGKYSAVYNNIHYGISGDYRAVHEYRKTDPRPRNVVSDFSGGITAGYVFKKYVADFNASLRIYKQSQNVEFYNELGANTSEFHFTGLGGHFARYMGSAYTQTRYRGRGYDLSVNILPKSAEGVFSRASGWAASAFYSSFTVDRNLPSENYANITRLWVQEVGGAISYYYSGNNMDWGIVAQGKYQLRQGDENIVDNGNMSENLILGSYTMYRNHIQQYKLQAVILLRKKGRVLHNIGLIPWAGFYRTQAQNIYPHRQMLIAKAGEGIDLTCSVKTGQWLITPYTGLIYMLNIDNSIYIPAAYTDPDIRSAFTNMYRRFRLNWVDFRAGASVQYRLPDNTALSFRANYINRKYHRHISVPNGNSEHTIILAIGFCF